MDLAPPALSGSGSVMGEMRALFTPPGRDSKRHQHYEELAGRTVELHPYYRRPGKGHNHDCCDACGEGGDLICCDQCPASFHFSCHAPPMEEEDIPMGDWMCLRCYVRERARTETIRVASQSQGSFVATTTVAAAATTSSTTTTTTTTAPAADGNRSEGEDEPVRETRSTRDANTPKPGARGSGRASRNTKKQLEAALKAEKEKTLKIYKQKYDKYLAVKPKTNSPFDALIAATQVCNAEQYKLPQEFETREQLPFSWKWAEERQTDDLYTKSCASCGKRRKIPAVACDFCPNVFHLDCLDPPLCEVPKERWMCPNHVEHVLDSKLLTSTRLSERLKLWSKYARGPIDTESVRLDFFRKARSGRLFQRSRIRNLRHEDRLQVPGYIKDQYARPSIGHPVDGRVDPVVHRDTSTDEDFLVNLISLQTSVAERQGLEVLKKFEPRRSKRRRKRQPAIARGSQGRVQPPKTEGEGDRIVENGKLSPYSSNTDNGNDSPVAEYLKDQDSDDTDSDCGFSLDEDEEDASTNLSAETRAEISQYLSQHMSGGRLKHISSSVRDLLALQRLQNLCPTKESPNLDSAVQARASVTPLYSSKAPTLMRYRSLHIGVGADLHLDLSSFSHCNYVSAKHATIYFDQYSQVYELINYSEHGTVVDNAIYALEYDTKIPVNRKRKRADIRSQTNVNFSMAERDIWRPCHCDCSVASMLTNTDGCENSAVLKHGSYIRMGCLQFVFSIMDYHGGATERDRVDNATVDKDKEKTEPTKEERATEVNGPKPEEGSSPVKPNDLAKQEQAQEPVKEEEAAE